MTERGKANALWKKFLRIVVPHKPKVFIIGLVLSTLLAPVFALIGNQTAQQQAYDAVKAFEPLHLLARYFQIIFTSCDNIVSPLLAHQDVCAQSPLSRHLPMALKPLSALVDVVLNAFTVGGFVGFLFAAAQVFTGVMVAWIWSRPAVPGAKRGFYTYLLGVPLGGVLLGSVLALPVWVIAWVGLTFCKGIPMVGSMIGLWMQTSSVGTVCTSVCFNATESFAHNAAVQGVTTALHVESE